MTNSDKWKYILDGLPSPDNYIEFGFLYLIGAALQRRVWVGPDHSRLYPNPYTILVGDPGVGKGLVVKQVAEVLRHHKLPDPNAENNKKMMEKAVTDGDKIVIDQMAKDDYATAHSHINGKDRASLHNEKPLLIPVAADATTYEALVRSVSKAIRRINYKEFDPQAQREIMKVYTHSSICFCLEEISSLFRKRTEDTVHFLLQAYDCGDYEYDTKTQGKDRVKRCCVSLFGGTTPAFMQETFDDKLLTEGFASRTLFIFAPRNRKTVMFPPALNSEQLQFRKEIIDHVEKLAYLHGRVQIEESTMKYLEEWWADQESLRTNNSLRLNPYYARKNIHVLKIAMALHFGSSLEMSIPKQTFIDAIAVLEGEEKRMHMALGLDTKNPLAIPSQKILRYLQAVGKKTRKELLAEFWSSLEKGAEDLDSILSHLETQNKVGTFTEPHPVTKQDILYYKART
jgi:hypothetical protein